MKLARLTLCFFSLALLGLLAADISGQWQAQVPGRDGNLMDTTFRFKVSGEALTGSIENQWGEREISTGKVSGDDVSFTVNIDAGGNQMTFLYKGKVAGNEIKFTRERRGGDGPPASVEFTAKRK